VIALLDSPHTWQKTDSIAGAATETMRQSHQLRATEWAMLLHGHQHHAGKTKRMAMQRAKAPRALPQQPGKCYLQLLLWKAEKGARLHDAPEDGQHGDAAGRGAAHAAVGVAKPQLQHRRVHARRQLAVLQRALDGHVLRRWHTSHRSVRFVSG